MQDTLNADNDTFDQSTLPPARQMPAVGERLRLVREAMGLSQGKFALRASGSPIVYDQYERGRMQPAIDQANKMRDAHGLTLDWYISATARV